MVQGTVERQGWRRAFDHVLVFDRLNLVSTAALEVGSRRLQMIHDEWKHKMPQLNGVAWQENLDLTLDTGEARSFGREGAAQGPR